MNLPDALAGQIDVSRETMDRLAAYVALVEKWQQRVNLVSASTLPDIWMRHIWDSAQLAPLVPASTGRILDVGSGAGFPGLILAALCDAELHLVESDQKKAVFLQTVTRETGIRAIVHNKRIESLPPISADGWQGFNAPVMDNCPNSGLANNGLQEHSLFLIRLDEVQFGIAQRR